MMRIAAEIATYIATGIIIAAALLTSAPMANAGGSTTNAAAQRVVQPQVQRTATGATKKAIETTIRHAKEADKKAKK